MLCLHDVRSSARACENEPQCVRAWKGQNAVQESLRGDLGKVLTDTGARSMGTPGNVPAPSAVPEKRRESASGLHRIQRLPDCKHMTNDYRRLTLAVLVSLLMHALLLSLTFGSQGLFPGFGFPWQVRRIQAPDLRVLVAPAQMVAAETTVTPAAESLPQASGEQPLASRVPPTPTPSAAPTPRPPASAITLRAKAKAQANATTDAATVASPARVPLRGDRPGDTTPPPVQPPPVIALTPTDEGIVPTPPAPTPTIAAAPTAPNTDIGMPSQRDAGDASARIDQEAREQAVALAKLELARQQEKRQEEQLETARQEAARQEAARQEAARTETARLEAERSEAARQLALRTKEAEQEAARQEAARLEAARFEAERQEAARLLAIRAKEAQEVAQQGAARVEAARLETERQEAARQAQREEAQREVARAEAAKVEVERQEAARQTAIRKEAALQEAARQEAAQAATARLEAERREAALREAARQDAAQAETARQEAERREAAQRESSARQEAAAQEAARREAARAAAEAERRQDDARREAARRAMGRLLDEEAARREAASAATRPPNTLPSSSGTRRGRLFGRADPNTELVLYAEAWARKIQLNMTFEMIREAVKTPHTHPVVTVAIRSDGSVESVTFVMSSGVPDIDEAVRRIVQSQLPYQAFPPGLARDFDVVEIRRTWYFDGAVRLY